MTRPGWAPTDGRDRRARAEAALPSGEPSYRLIVDTIPALIATVTAEGQVEHVNRQVCEYFGRTLDELKKWATADAVHPDDLPRVIGAWRHAVATGLPHEIEHRMRRADGVYRWFQVRGVPQRGDNERIVRWYVLMTDIDERKASETRLQSSLNEIERLKDENEQHARRRQAEKTRLHAARQYRTVLETATDAVVTIDATGKIRLVNPAVTVAVRADVSLALATEETLRGILQSCAEAVVKHLGAAFARIWVITKDGRFLELLGSAGMYTHLDGAHRLVPVGHLNIGLIAQEGKPYVSNQVIDDPRLGDRDWARVEGMVAFAGFPLLAGGRVVGVLAMFSRERVSQAVTETLAAISDTIAQGIQRKRAEEEVRRSEAFLAEAQALSQTGSWGWNTATGELYWSRETYRIFGFEPDVNPTLSMVAEAIHPDDRARFESDAETLARDHTDFASEYRLKLRDDSIKHVHVVGRFAARVFRDLDFIGSIMDVTERKRAADALLKTQSELAEVTRLATMGELAASIAHEINQPLASVVTNAQTCGRMLRAQPPPWDDVASAVSDIAEAGKRASDVIARIRLLLRKGVSEPVELSVNDVIRDVIALTRDATRQKRVVLDTRLTHDVPRVLADRIQLQQVLINLITNAADAMCDVTDRARTVTISSSWNDELQVEVAVEDAGVGIDPKYRDRIFDPLFTTKADGMGMGLAICRGIVEAHGGRLWATPNPAFGTTVRLALPAVATEEG